MSENPYQCPTSEVGLPVRDDATKNDIAPVVLEHLRGTRPWVKFCSLAGYIAALFILIIDALTVRKMLGSFPLYQTLLLACFYIVLAILFIIPSIRLSKYERSITRLLVSNRIEDLEQAIAHQRTFWKQMGIMILILLILYLLTISFSAIILLSGKL